MTQLIIDELLARCQRDHEAWINGDASHYALPEDGTLMGAFGASGRGGPRTSGRQRTANSLWLSGSGSVELIAAGVCDGVAWMVMIERAMVEFLGQAAPRRWDLRVTELFRETKAGWERFHRHADPLVDVHGLDEMLALLP